MKIICIGRNYLDHIKELDNEVPKAPLVFLKPATALLVNNKAFYIPEHSNDVHFEAEIVLKICKNGRHVKPEFASGYYKEATIGIDFTARDVQQACKAAGHPWEIAKGFDHSAPVGTFLPMDNLITDGHISFSLEKNGETMQRGDSRKMIHSFDDIICYISRFFKLQVGDYVFTGTPAGVGPVQIGDVLTTHVAGQTVLRCPIK